MTSTPGFGVNCFFPFIFSLVFLTLGLFVIPRKFQVFFCYYLLYTHTQRQKQTQTNTNTNKHKQTHTGMSVAVDASADADTAGPREEGAQLSFRRGPTPDGRGIGESEGLGRIPRQRLEAHLHGNAAEPGAWPVRCYCRGHARVALALQGVYRDAGRQVGRSVGRPVPLWSLSRRLVRAAARIVFSFVRR